MMRKTLTILFADIQGYTFRTARQTREQNEIFIKEIRSFVEKHAVRKGGTLVKSMGDGFLLTFESPTDAVACGLEIQKEAEQRNAKETDPADNIRFRIGISTGEITLDDTQDVFGDAVNIAARIQKFCRPNEVYISEATYLAMNKTEIAARDLGPQQFKNVSYAVRVYKVWDKSGAPPLPPPQPARNFSPGAVLGISAVIISALFFFVFFKKKAPEPELSLTTLPAEIERRLNIGSFDEAIDLLKTFLEKHPDNAKLHTMTANAYLKTGNHRLAEFHLNRATVLDPQDAAAYHIKAVLLERMQRYEEAIKQLGEYVIREKDPQKKNQAIAAMREIEQKIAQKPSARLPQAPEITPAVPEEQDSGAAQDPPAEETPPVQMKQVMTKNGFEPEAIEEPDEEEPVSPYADERDYIERLMRAGNYPEVIRWIEKKLQQNPDDAKLYLLAGDVYTRMREFFNAHESLQKAQLLAPEIPMIYFKRAVVFEQEGRYRDAIRMLEETLRRQPRKQLRIQAQYMLNVLKNR